MDYGRVEFPAFQVSKEDLEALDDFCERNSTKKLPESRAEQMRWMISRFLVDTELTEEADRNSD